MPTPAEKQIEDENINARALLGNDDQGSADDGGSGKKPAAKQEEGDEEKRPEPRVRGIDERRAEIYARARRSRQQDDEISSLPEDREKQIFGEGVETRADRRARQAEDADEGSQPQQRAPEGPRHKLRVNGREIELSEQEVIAAAQKAVAADDIIEHAKQLRGEQMSILAELRALRENQPQAETQPKPAQRRQPETKVDDDKLDEIIDKLQFGEKEDAIAALEKYGERIEKRVLERVGNLDETIDQHLRIADETANRRRETETTLNEFSRENPEFTDKPALQAALAYEAADTMRQRMFDIGVRPETLEQLQHKFGLNDLEVAGFAYRKLQEMGNDLPAHVEILKSSADNIRSQFGLPARTRQTQQQDTRPGSFDATARLERKRSLTPQPRRATATPKPDASEVSRDAARLQVIRQMKATRRGR